MEQPTQIHCFTHCFTKNESSLCPTEMFIPFGVYFSFLRYVQVFLCIFIVFNKCAAALEYIMIPLK